MSPRPELPSGEEVQRLVEDLDAPEPSLAERLYLQRPFIDITPYMKGFVPRAGDG